MTWSHALSPSQMALVSAALRHLTDARTLLATSPVQAAYLAGYGPECARKVVFERGDEPQEDARNRAIGHGFGKPAESALRWFCDLDPLASRYEVRGWKAAHPVLAQWSELIRYGRSDSLSKATATKIVDAATERAIPVVAALWADGRLEPLDTLIATRP